MANSFEATGLWQRTLAPQANDGNALARDRLRSALLRMRDHVRYLVEQIPQDCRGLTVHDISHLDALWEMADLISGDAFDLTPAEAFVFGGAVLLHDAGMSVASFKGGIAELSKTTEWADISSFVLRRRLGSVPAEISISNPPDKYRDEIVFNVLRALHAKQAEHLVSLQWTIPGSGDIRLLEDTLLRNSYGKSIGRIAYSHHWDIQRVADELREHIGAATELPPEWVLNEVKVACLLRCADAAHIDDRRAPSMLYALSRPAPSSDPHWSFQNKLNKPLRRSDSLVYSSGQDFEIQNAPAWWLCFDTIRMIDRELNSANALLQDIGAPTFAAKRVFGAENPRILSKYIRPMNWEPVNAEITVSDPIHLAQTLGGRNLYGENFVAPVRELLQNAIDAVRARRAVEKRSADWGRVRLTFEILDTDGAKRAFLRVDDTGIGMSERVLGGPLLDFGNSLWGSSSLREEFPGLQSSGLHPIGKFGIGFFSVFLLGESVKVISHRYDKGPADARVLEFSSIAARPIIRKAFPHETASDFSTSIVVEISKFPAIVAVERGEEENDQWRRYIAAIRSMIAPIDVTIEIVDKLSNQHYLHDAHWTDVPARVFLDELFAVYDEVTRKRYISIYEHQISLVVGADGAPLGRAAISFLGRDDYIRRHRRVLSSAFASVGGFAVAVERASYCGVLEGETDDVARRSASATVSKSALAIWASEQASLVNKERYQVFDLIRVAHNVCRFGGDPKDLPFCHMGGAFKTRADFRGAISGVQRIRVPLDQEEYDDKLDFENLRHIGAQYFFLRSEPDVIVIEHSPMSESFLKYGVDVDRELPVELARSDLAFDFSESAFGLLWEEVLSIWGNEPKMRIEKSQIFSMTLADPPSEVLVLSLHRG